MKSGQSVEVNIQPMDVSIGNSPEPCGGGTDVDGRRDGRLVVG
jgi:hypothetical protein